MIVKGEIKANSKYVSFVLVLSLIAFLAISAVGWDHFLMLLQVFTGTVLVLAVYKFVCLKPKPIKKIKSIKAVERPNDFLKFKGEYSNFADSDYAMNLQQAAVWLNLLPTPLGADVVMRMANLEQIPPDIIREITAILEQKLRSLVDFSRESHGGIRAVAELINQMDAKAAAAILEKIEGENSSLALSIRNLMFAFDDVMLIDDAGMREILQRVDKKALTFALKGTREEVRNRFFRNMSMRAVEMMKEDLNVLGPVKAKDVETSQKQIVRIVRKLVESGAVSRGAEYIS
jgi:hypothetical protein